MVDVFVRMAAAAVPPGCLDVSRYVLPETHERYIMCLHHQKSREDRSEAEPGGARFAGVKTPGNFQYPG